jgi:flagellar biosynthesis protein FlhF
MKVRRYFAPSMREALEAVRKEQGVDALILSNRNVEGGIEIMTATGQMDEAEIESMTRRAAKPPASDSVATTQNLWTHPDTVVQMQRELGAIKGLIEQQLSSFAWQDFRGRHPLQARLMDGLTRMGFAAHLGQQVVSVIDDTTDYDTAWQQVLGVLHDGLRSTEDPLRHGGVAAFCGATGVGKTTLVSKLAARYALAHGTAAVAVISADEQRLGAHHQLRTFGRLLGIQVETARDQASLAACLRTLENKSLVLIDLPGYAPADGQSGQGALDLCDLGDAVQLYLVTTATTEYLALKRILKAFAKVPLAGCCLSKLDEAAAFGAALSMLYESRLPLTYISEGQQVPDDNLRMTRHQLIQRAETLSMQYAPPGAIPTPEPAFALSAAM